MTTQQAKLPASQLENKLNELNQYKIDLGLDRLHQVLQRLKLSEPQQQIITVGGTNGKGSTVAALSSLLTTQGKSYGAFTSPHIFKFNERINIDGRLATDDEILEAFEMIDAAKAAINLSYFEYAFLAAVIIFKQQGVDVMLLEVGLGGRLDATNALDADACVITTVDIDHTEWLGDSIDKIAQEKAGIMRANMPVVYGDTDMPSAIDDQANKLNAKLIQLDKDFQFQLNDQSFSYQLEKHSYIDLNRPQLKGDWQIKNFSSALTALLSLGYCFNTEQVQQAINGWQIQGRLQTIQDKPLVLADVAHNRQSVKQLVQYLKDNPIKGQTRAVFSVLADKDLDSWIGDLDEVIDHWFTFELTNSRAMDVLSLKTILANHVTLSSQFESAKYAYEMTLRCSEPEDRVIVFGSFHVLEEVFK